MASWNWLHEISELFSRESPTEYLRRLSDHMLADIGLRRDQLDLMSLEELDAEQKPRDKKPAVAPTRPKAARYPTLQGCG